MTTLPRCTLLEQQQQAFHCFVLNPKRERHKTTTNKKIKKRKVKSLDLLTAALRLLYLYLSGKTLRVRTQRGKGEHYKYRYECSTAPDHGSVLAPSPPVPLLSFPHFLFSVASRHLNVFPTLPPIPCRVTNQCKYVCGPKRKQKKIQVVAVKSKIPRKHFYYCTYSLFGRFRAFSFLHSRQNAVHLHPGSSPGKKHRRHVLLVKQKPTRRAAKPKHVCRATFFIRRIDSKNFRLFFLLLLFAKNTDKKAYY